MELGFFFKAAMMETRSTEMDVVITVKKKLTLLALKITLQKVSVSSVQISSFQLSAS